MPEKHPLFGSFLVLGYTLCSVFAYLTVKHVLLIQPDISPLNAIFWGFLGATIVAGSFILGNKKERSLVKKEWYDHKKLILSISFITSLGVILWVWSLQLANAGTVGLIGRADLLMTISMGALFLGEKFSWKTILGAIVAITGLCLVANLPNEISLFAVGIILLMRFVYSIQSFLVKKSGQKLRGIPFTFWRIAIITGILFIISIVFGTLHFPSPTIIGFLIVSQVFGGYLGRVFYFEAHKHLGIGHINLLSLIQPVLLLIGASIFLNEPMPSQKILGAIILITGLMIIVLERSELNKKFSLLRIFATLRGKRNVIENPIDFS